VKVATLPLTLGWVLGLPANDSGSWNVVSRNPDVIVAMGTPGLTAVRQHTHSVPVVFTLVGDPVRSGLIESLARPGGTQQALPTLSSPLVENGWSCQRR